MGQVLHGCATTTETIRRAIQHSQESLRTLSKRYGINPKTVAKWRQRSSVADLPTGPKEPKSTVLSIEDEAIIVAFRRHTLLPLDDCLYALQPTIPHLTRSSLHRCLQRHGISQLPDVEGSKPAKKKFKTYPIGFFHIDIAEVRTEEGKLHLFVAIDRTSKFAFVELHEKATTKVAAEFLRHLIVAVPYKIHTILTDNGIHFTIPGGGGLTVGEIKEALARGALFRAHAFELACARNDIDHRLTKPKHPWTNGQVERMNRTIKEATVQRFYYESHQQLRQHLADFVAAYNFGRRLKTLKGLTPFEYICKSWTSQPQRFILNPLQQMPGLNMLGGPPATTVPPTCGPPGTLLTNEGGEASADLDLHRCARRCRVTMTAATSSRKALIGSRSSPQLSDDKAFARSSTCCRYRASAVGCSATVSGGFSALASSASSRLRSARSSSERFADLVLLREPFDVGLEDAVEVPLDPRQALLDARPVGDQAGREAFALLVIGLDIGRDQVRRGQVGFQPVEDRALDHVEVIDAAVIAGSGLLHLSTLNALPALARVLDRHAGAAAAAFQKAGEDPLGLAGVAGKRTAALLLDRARPLEEVLLDDPQVRRVDGLPLGGRIGARDAFAGVRVLDHPDLVPDDAARIEVVQDQAVMALERAVDGRGRPIAAPRRRNLTGVQPGRDIPRRPAVHVGLEYLADDAGLVLVDLQLPRLARHRACSRRRARRHDGRRG